jgi:predicted nucleic acid-binding protein
LTLLDASALLSLLLRQPAGSEVSALLYRGNCAVPAPCLTEVVDLLIRKHGGKPDQVVERLGPLLEEKLPVVSTDRGIGWRAGELHAAHYHRKTAALSLPDCILLASAGPGDEIASSDSAVIDVARKLEIDVIALPVSDGQPPTSGA